MMDSLLQQDAEHRQRALDLESFIVEAPAGAGKTELLTQRYLRLLATVDEPEEIIAITFTNKAAGEMRERIAESLAMARSGVLPAAEHKCVTFALATAALARAKELDWQIETQPGRLRLTTIDALCASLARQMPYLSRFGAQPAVAEDVQRHYEEAARRALDHLDSDGAMADAVAVALAHLDNDSGRLATLLAQMLARREQWRSLWQMHSALDHPESALGSALAALVSEDLLGVVDSLGFGVQARAMPLARYAADNLGGSPLTDWSEPLGEDPDDLPRWRALADFLLTKEGERRKQVTVKNGFPPADKAAKAAMLELLASLDERAVTGLRRLRELPTPAQGDDAVVRALVQLLQLAAAELWLVFRERGEVDFGELAARAIDALGDEAAPSELALRLDYQIRHLLVDEFQDTSPLQIELLARLTAGWQPGDGRTLFAVGDPMQSIYRFRKADVGLFLRVAESGIGELRLEKLRLSRNNRSHPEVVDWINAHFPAVFPVADEPLRGEIRYRPFVATREPLADAGVSIHPVLADEAGDARDALEARTLIDIIAAEWRADPQRTIAVLVRARGHLSALVAAIRREAPAWRFSAVEIEPLAGRQVVQDLISLTRALHHRADRLHWLAILRAPWCGLTLADLHALAGDDHAATMWSLMNDVERVARLSTDGQHRLAHVRGVLAEALAGQGRQSRRRWVEDVWKKLGGPRCSDAAGALDARAFFDRLDVLDAAARFTVDSLEDDMARLFAAADALADGRLQLMTVHKSKGLEFDTVILPGLHREPSGRDTPLLAWDTFALADGERLVAAPVNRHRGKSATPTVYDFLQRMERERSSNEEARVLYVAATRAVRRLHLVGAVVRKEEGGITTPRSASALARLWPALEAEFLAAAAVPPEPTFSDTEDLALFVPQLVRLAAPAVPSVSGAWAAPAMDEPVVQVKDDTADPLAAAVGTLTHACLEQIAAAPESWSPARANDLLPALVQWLASRGWAPAEAQSGAARTAAMLVATLESELGCWVLRQRDDMAAELVLSKVGAGGTAQTRVIDRCFVEAGVRWIVDYKTARIAASVLAEAQIEQQLAVHAERYREQLEEYGALLAGESLPQRLAVFYLAYGRLIVLE